MHGDNVAMGYWRNPQLTERTFGGKLVNPSPGTPQGPWLRTGDLGVMSDGELFIIGRIKDLLIVDGRNHYPDDIEATIQEITGGRVAAISVPDDRSEQLVAIAELKKRGGSRGGAGQASRREAGSRLGDQEVAQRAGRGSGPGAAGVDSDHDQRQGTACGVRGAVPTGRVQPFGRHYMTSAFDEAAVRHWLVDYLVTNIGCSPDEIDFDAPLNDLAVGSSDAVVLSGELSELLGRTVSPVEFWQYPTINALARFLTGGEVEPRPRRVDGRERGSMDEPIAVIGVGCRFPGDIHGPEALWQFLSEGRSAVGEVPPDRWASFDDGSPEGAAALAGTTRWGSFLSDIDAFDAEFFEISPSEAAKMDPQQRLLLEVAHEALEHAGIPAHSLRHTQTGVFAGACVGEYGYLATADLSQVDAWSGTGGALSIIANRVSYFFDLRGPSVTVDTACSSSLVAVHLACQSLRTGDSNLGAGRRGESAAVTGGHPQLRSGRGDVADGSVSCV